MRSSTHDYCDNLFEKRIIPTVLYFRAFVVTLTQNHRIIIIWWCLNRYYSMIWIWCYYLVSYFWPAFGCCWALQMLVEIFILKTISSFGQIWLKRLLPKFNFSYGHHFSSVFTIFPIFSIIHLPSKIGALNLWNFYL